MKTQFYKEELFGVTMVVIHRTLLSLLREGSNFTKCPRCEFNANYLESLLNLGLHFGTNRAIE